MASPMDFQNQYLSAPQMFNPNQQETEEQRRMRLQAEQLSANMATDEEVAAARDQLKRADALRDREGPKGRRVGSRDTFVAASPLEHLAHVWASKVRGDTAKKAKEELGVTLGKQRMGQATARQFEMENKEEIRRIAAKQADDLGARYEDLSKNAQDKLEQNVLKMAETERHNKAMEEARLKDINSKDDNFKKPTQGQMTTMQNMRFGIDAVAHAGTTFEDSYSRPLGGLPVVSQWAIDAATTAGVDPTNIAAGLKAVSGIGGLGGDQSGTVEEKEARESNFLDAARWLASWRQGYTLWQRNQLFGATLTPSEQKAWNAAGEINLNMEPDEIRKRVAGAEEIMRKRADAAEYTSVTAGQNPQLWTGMGTAGGYDPEASRAAPVVSTRESTAANMQKIQEGLGQQGQQQQKVISYKDVSNY